MNMNSNNKTLFSKFSKLQKQHKVLTTPMLALFKLHHQPINPLKRGFKPFCYPGPLRYWGLHMLSRVKLQ